MTCHFCSTSHCCYSRFTPSKRANGPVSSKISKLLNGKQFPRSNSSSIETIHVHIDLRVKGGPCYNISLAVASISLPEDPLEHRYRRCFNPTLEVRCCSLRVLKSCSLNKKPCTYFYSSKVYGTYASFLCMRTILSNRHFVPLRTGSAEHTFRRSRTN